MNWAIEGQNFIPALSVLQPWASALVAVGDDRKDVENRTWVPAQALMGRRIAIHASKRQDSRQFADYRALVKVLGADPLGLETAVEGLPFGAVIGVVTLAEIIKPGQARPRGVSGWYAPGCIGLVMTEPILLPEPVPCQGALNFWALPRDVEKAVCAQIAVQIGRAHV